MTTYLRPSPSPGLVQGASRLARAARTSGCWTNRLLTAVAVAQFYFAGLAIFGAAGLELHRAGGWLAQLLSLLTTILLLIARVPFRASLLAIVLLVLTILQPVLAFAFRATLPVVSALHPVNGLAIIAVSLLLERHLRHED